MPDNTPTIQPGSRIKTISGPPGSQGPFGISDNGKLFYLTTAHQTLNAERGDRLYFDPELVSVSESIPVSEIQDQWNYEQSDFEREFEDHAHSEPEINSEVIPHDISLNIKDVVEHLPMVLKEPIPPEQGSTVFKSGIKTGVTEGEVIETDTRATVKPEMRTIYLKDQFRTTRMGKKGDSGSYVLTKDTYEPVGLFSVIDKNSTFHTKLTTISGSINSIGFYAPISLPHDIPALLEEVISIIIPDGVFKQRSNLVKKDWRKIAHELGLHPAEFEKKPIRSDRYSILDIPDKTGDAGSLWFTNEGKIIGLQTAATEKYTSIMKIDRVLNALDLELINGLDRKSTEILGRAGYWNLRCQECGSIMSPASGCWFCAS